MRAGEPVATLVDTSRLRLRFRVPEESSATLVPGKVTIRFRTAALPGKELSAALLYVQSSADPQTRMVECLAEVASPDPALKPGFFANVIVDVQRAAAAPVVPEESALATERGLVVYLVADGKAKESKVRLGLRTADGWVEVVEGLVPGATVVVENAWVLEDGRTVETYPSKRATTATPAPAGAAGAAGPEAPAPPPGAGK